jgi:choline dehydrogenase-like flavoprotein
MAARFAGQRLSVLLLESGGFNFDQAANDLNTIERSDSPYTTYGESRRRQVGGTAHLWNTRLGHAWGARFIRLSDVDLEARDCVPNSGWPFSVRELASYYDQAEAVCRAGHDDDEKEAEGAWFRCAESPVGTYVERFGLARVFTHDLPSQLHADQSVALVAHATVTELLTDPSGVRIAGIRYVRPGGTSDTVEASVVVLAAGGIENARLLLLSRAVHKSGLGNAHDLVGRYFMDHHRFDWGVLLPAHPDVFDGAHIFDLLPARRGFRMGKLTVAPAILRSAQLLNSSVQVTPRLSSEQYRIVTLARQLVARNGGGRLEALADLGRKWRLGAGIADTGLRLAWHQKRFPGRLDFGMWSRLPGRSARFAALRLLQIIEQAPCPDNRVRLIEARDSLGQPRVRVECGIQSGDIDSMFRTRSLIAAELDRKRIGRVAANDGLILQKTGGIHHHIGTTRMHASSRHGVTDANAEVHDVRNLFIVGSSVFPTAGYANPTLTILALAIRTADHIAHRLASTYELSAGRVS